MVDAYIKSVNIIKKIGVYLLLCIALSACAGLKPLPGENGGDLVKTNLGALPGNAKAFVDWDAITGATDYTVNWAGPIDPEVLSNIDIASLEGMEALVEALAGYGQVVATGSTDVNEAITLIQEGLVNGVAYCYESLGFADGEEVGYSNIGCAIPMGSTLAATVAKSLAVTVNWDPALGAVSYNVYRSLLGLVPDLSKVVGDQVICEDMETGELIRETDQTTIEDINDISDCKDYCYTVKPINSLGQELNEQTKWVLARPSNMGQLDQSFADGGSFSLVDEIGDFTDVAVAPDDGIIVTDSSDLQVAAIKYSADLSSMLWSVDLSTSMSRVNALYLDTDGEGNELVFVTGSIDIVAGDSRMVICKVANGELDTTFGNMQNGCSQYPTASIGNDITLDSNGNILIAGATGPITNNYFTVWNINPTGDSLNWLYRNGDPQYTRVANALEVLEVGGREQVFAAGFSLRIFGGAVVPRELMVAALDNSNGSELHAVMDSGLGGTTVGNDVAIMTDGSLMVIGKSQTGSLGTPADIYLWNYATDFSQVDIYPYDLNEDDAGMGLRLDCRQRPVVAGNVGVLGSNEMAVLRTDDLFVLDDLFGNTLPNPDGWFVDSIGSALKWSEDSVGRYIVSGRMLIGPRTRPTIWRLK